MAAAQGKAGVQQRFVEQDFKALCITRDVSLVAPFSDVTKLVQFAWKPGHFFCEPLSLAVTRPRVHASVNGGFWTNFLRFLRDGGPGS